MTAAITEQERGRTAAVRGKPFPEMVRKAFYEGRRIVVPLMGFPGLNLTGCSVKLAQQNYGEHFKVLKAIADRYRPDAVFPMMDLSVEANAIGRYTFFPKEESATVVRDEFRFEDLEAAERVNISFDARLLGYVETLKLMNIGFPSNILRGAYVTGPYTLAALLMGAEEAAASTVANPEMLHVVCSFATSKIQQYLRLLIAAGAQIICVLEPSAVMLGPEQFDEFSGMYVSHLCESCSETEVSTVYHVCGNSMHLIKSMARSGVDALSLDSPEAGVDLRLVAEKTPEDVILIGNLNPTGSILFGKPDEVEKDVGELLETMRDCPNFVLSTGCDLPQETPDENVVAFMKAGRNYRFK